MEMKKHHVSHARIIIGGVAEVGPCGGNFGSGIKDLLGGGTAAGSDRGAGNYIVGRGTDGASGGAESIAVFSGGAGVSDHGGGEKNRGALEN